MNPRTSTASTSKGVAGGLNRLTEVAIRAAKLPPGKSKHNLADGGGLRLELWANGSKYWRQDYRSPLDGKQKTIPHGVYPVITLAMARERRAEVLALRARGIDPMVQRKALRTLAAAGGPPTFDSVAAEWLVEHKRQALSGARTESYLLRHASPVLGSRPIAEITAQEVLAMLKRIEASGHWEVLKRVRIAAGQVFTFATLRGLCAGDPVHVIRKAFRPPPTVNAPILEGDAAIGGLARAIRGYEGEPTTRVALELLLLTFVRSQEVRLATWAEFDLDGPDPTWRIAAERMKTRRKHHVPLAPQAVTLLRAWKQQSRGKFLFSYKSPNSPLSTGTLGGAFKRMGFAPKEITPHGVRGTAVTHYISRGGSETAASRQLAHKPGGADASYMHALGSPERKELMTWWASELDRCAALPGSR